MSLFLEPKEVLKFLERIGHKVEITEVPRMIEKRLVKEA